jgi:LysM repeat protein
MPDPRLITLTAGKLAVTALRGQTAPAATGGFGGWNKVARPRRKALTVWGGIEPYQQAFSIIFDGLLGDVSVETGIRTLELMAMPPATGQEPPLVRVAGAVPRPGLTYVIETLEWDPAPMWSRNGYRVRQEATVHLLEYVRPDRLVQSSGAEKARTKAAATATKVAAGGKSHKRSYTVRSGDTLSKIAAHQLGDYKRWPEIAKLNGIRDPKKLRIGQVIKLP